MIDERMKYWEDNIDKWNMYYKYSHSKEEFQGSALFRIIYRHFIGPIEAFLMKKRYEITKQFIHSNLKPNETFNDLGCGAGMFTVLALQIGAKVNAVDFTKAALKLTREAVRFHALDESKVDTVNLDLRNDIPPRANVTIAMGLAPYISDIEHFLLRVFPKTDVLMFNYVSDTSLMNRFRMKFPTLNVRGLEFHNTETVDLVASRCGFTLLSRQKLGTGFVDTFVREKKVV